MSKNYKDSLLMPHTSFDMRANLKSKEPKIQQFWQTSALYQQLLQQNQATTKTFILHDGPPYANGDLHLGHALNKILKDFIVRYYNANQIYAPLITGWDTHGLPIEQAVSASGINRKSVNTATFRQACQTYANQQVINQKQQFQRLGLLTDFQATYLTFDKTYEATQIRLFAKMVEQNLIYRNLYPVYWSPTSESALAEAEIEYQNKKSPAIYVGFKLEKQTKLKTLNDSELVIWTTTPWTIPANQLLAVNETFNYQLLLVNNQKKVIIAEQLVPNFLTAAKITNYQVLKPAIAGSELVGLVTLHPLYQRLTTVVSSNHVTLESGTGIVHIAPGFGVDDFLLGKKAGIKILVPIDDQGYFTSAVNDPLLVNQFYDDCNKIIVERLKTNQHLWAMNWITHSYPHDWRTKKPVIFRATEQWFVALKQLKPELLKALQPVQFWPDWGKKRIETMIEKRQDWCISRQRAWGVPIPIFYTERRTPILDAKLINHVADLFAKHGSNIWYEKPAEALLPANYQHPDSPNQQFQKETDIMDVWFDSGISHCYISEKYHLKPPFNLYLEGNDQFRGWFNSSLITGLINQKSAPYQAVVAHGFVNDEKGNKLSKSSGNFINLQQICADYGADILRLWVASVDYQDDCKFGPEILKQISENYRKIRNLIRFLLGNLHDFKIKDYQTKSINDLFPTLTFVDQAILVRLNEIISSSHHDYQNYRFNAFYQTILNFITNDLSAFYCDFSKDILYANQANDIRRRQIQTTFYLLLKTLLPIMMPILPHTCEEAYQALYQTELDKKQISILLEPYPSVVKLNNAEQLKMMWTVFMLLRNDVNQALSLAQKQGIIKIPLEAEVVLVMKNEQLNTTIFDAETLAQLLIVSGVIIRKKLIKMTLTTERAQILIQPKNGTKCRRCWLIYEVVDINEICQRCQTVLTNQQVGK